MRSFLVYPIIALTAITIVAIVFTLIEAILEWSTRVPAGKQMALDGIKLPVAFSVIESEMEQWSYQEWRENYRKLAELYDTSQRVRLNQGTRLLDLQEKVRLMDSKIKLRDTRHQHERNHLQEMVALAELEVGRLRSMLPPLHDVVASMEKQTP